MRFTDEGGERIARLANPAAVTPDDMVTSLIDIYDTTTIGQLRVRLASGIIAIVGAGRGLRHRGGQTYSPEGTRFTADLRLTETTATLMEINYDAIKMEYAKERPGFKCITTNGNTTNTLTEPHYRYHMLEKRLAIGVIDSLATAIHEQHPDYGVDNRIAEKSPVLFSEIAVQVQ